MSAEDFFDSNVLLYLLSADTTKADRAETLLAGGGIISVQVLNELANVCTRKLGMSWPETDVLLAGVCATCRVEHLTEATFDTGRRLAERYQFSVYDAMIVAAALLAGVKTLYSEDMHDGLRVEKKLVVCNPFRG
jgi:predicted nucleic acid-binding protein